jgi:hypothetical protein
MRADCLPWSAALGPARQNGPKMRTFCFISSRHWNALKCMLSLLKDAYKCVSICGCTWWTAYPLKCITTLCTRNRGVDIHQWKEKVRKRFSKTSHKSLLGHALGALWAGFGKALEYNIYIIYPLSWLRVFNAGNHVQPCWHGKVLCMLSVAKP